MAFQLSSEALAKLAARKKDYVASLIDKRAELEQLSAPVLAGDLSASELEPLREAVHKIAGSAGLYGFPLLQQKASELDLALLQIGSLNVPAQPHIADLINQMLAAFDTE